jgi:hypothetical protein
MAALRRCVMPKDKPRLPRSAKAGSPPTPVVSPPRVRRRAKSARAAVRKDTMVKEVMEGPRSGWSGSKPSWKKR